MLCLELEQQIFLRILQSHADTYIDSSYQSDSSQDNICDVLTQHLHSIQLSQRRTQLVGSVVRFLLLNALKPCYDPRFAPHGDRGSMPWL